MAPPGICPQCGDGLPADVPHGICPKCLLGLGFDDPSHTSERAFQPTQEPGRRFTPPAPAELAAHFPQLEILELLGQGGMGAVYRARQRTLDRIVALKVLPPEVGQDPAFAERFSREARALARLTHPNIVMILDFGESNGYCFFIMEYVDGVNLRQSLQAGRLTPEQALAIVPQVCEALQYAHDQGIVHRDIKPENVLLDKRGRVKIADFGLAKLLGRTGGRLSLTGTGQVMGTPHYMAPEQMEKPLTVDHRADIYSLGVVFYELLTGELPLGRFAPPSEKANVSADLDQVVLRTLEKEPERRYQHASDVKTAVESLGGASAGYASPAGATAGQPRLRVPFSIGDVYSGFARADGILHYDGRQLILEFQVMDDLIGCLSSAVKTVAVPLSEVVSLQLAPGWFRLKSTLELRTDNLFALRDVPRSERGIVRMQVARKDAEAAQQIVDAVRRTVEPVTASVVAGAEPAKPPVAQAVHPDSSAAESVRGPAVGLTVVGILDCLAIVLLMLLLPVVTIRSTEVEPNGPPIEVTDASAGESVMVDSDGVTVSSPYGRTLTPMRTVWAGLLLVPLISLMPLTYVIIMMVGAGRMRRLRSHGLAMTAAILAIVPLHPTFLLGLPMGIWALLVLIRPATRDAFRRREQQSALPANASWTSDESPRPVPGKPPRAGDLTAREALRAPGMALMIIGLLNGACAVLLLFNPMSGQGTPLVLFALLLFPCLVSLFEFLGGWHMLNGPSHKVCMLGAMAAWCPVSPLWIVSLPMGIWAMVVLQRPEVKEVYGIPTDGARDSARPGAARHSSFAPVVLVLIVLFLAAAIPAAAVLGWIFLAHSAPSPSMHSVESGKTEVWAVPEMPPMPPMPAELSDPHLTAPAAPTPPQAELPPSQAPDANSPQSAEQQ